MSDQGENQENVQDNFQDAPEAPVARNWAAATGDAPLDLANNRFHQKHFEAGEKSLYARDADRFGLEPEKLQNFLARLTSRHRKIHFSTLEIPSVKITKIREVRRVTSTRD